MDRRQSDSNKAELERVPLFFWLGKDLMPNKKAGTFFEFRPDKRTNRNAYFTTFSSAFAVVGRLLESSRKSRMMFTVSSLVGSRP